MPRFIVKREGSMSSVTDCRLKLCRVRISITGGSCKPEVHSFNDNTASGQMSYQYHSSIFLFCPISSCIFDIISLIQPVSYKGTFLHYSNMQWCKINRCKVWMHLFSRIMILCQNRSCERHKGEESVTGIQVKIISFYRAFKYLGWHDFKGGQIRSRLLLANGRRKGSKWNSKKSYER